MIKKYIGLAFASTLFACQATPVPASDYKNTPVTIQIARGDITLNQCETNANCVDRLLVESVLLIRCDTPVNRETDALTTAAAMLMMSNPLKQRMANRIADNAQDNMGGPVESCKKVNAKFDVPEIRNN